MLTGMRHTYDVDPDERLVSVVSLAHPTDAERAELIREILTHPDYQPGFDLLIDHRLRAGAQTEEEMRSMLAKLGELEDELKASKVAIVVSRASQMQTVRKAAILAALDGRPFEIAGFFSVAAARRWLWGAGAADGS
jgi:hypothetical protein